MMERSIKEPIMPYKGSYLVYGGYSSRIRSELYDELTMKEKEFANEIYIQRCKEKYI